MDTTISRDVFNHTRCKLDWNSKTFYFLEIKFSVNLEEMSELNYTLIAVKGILASPGSFVYQYQKFSYSYCIVIMCNCYNYMNPNSCIQRFFLKMLFVNSNRKLF